jgi:hypothetical protein
MATVGLAGLLSLVGASDAQSLSNAQRVALGVVSGGAVAALMVAGRAAHRHPAVRSVLLAVAAGIAFSMSSVFTKTVAVDWSQHVSLANLSSLAAIGAFATAGMLISQASYRGAGLEAPLATLTVVNPVVAAAVGITMFGETFRYGTVGTVLALGCGVVAAGGLILLTIERIGSGERTTPSAPEPAAVPEPVAVMEPVTAPQPVAVPQPVAAGVPEADAGQRADAPHAPTSVPAPVALAAASGPRLPGPAVSRPRLAEPAVPAAGGLGALTAAEAAVAELLAGLPEPTDPPEGADGFVPAAQPGAGRQPGAGSVAHTARAGSGSVPQAAGAGGDGVFPPALRSAGAGAFVPAPVKAAVPTMGVVAAGHPEARDELPYLTVMLGVPYVPIPFVSHHRTRVKS